jgi:hypothetical protein
MAPEKGLEEKPPPGNGPETEVDHDAVSPAPAPGGRWARTWDLLRKAAAFGRVEVRGITPIPVKERTVERTVNVFTLWWSMNTNILG